MAMTARSDLREVIRDAEESSAVSCWLVSARETPVSSCWCPHILPGPASHVVCCALSTHNPTWCFCFRGWPLSSPNPNASSHSGSACLKQKADMKPWPPLHWEGVLLVWSSRRRSSLLPWPAQGLRHRPWTWGDKAWKTASVEQGSQAQGRKPKWKLKSWEWIDLGSEKEQMVEMTRAKQAWADTIGPK